jgi:hypothetical protein
MIRQDSKFNEKGGVVLRNRVNRASAAFIAGVCWIGLINGDPALFQASSAAAWENRVDVVNFLVVLLVPGLAWFVWRWFWMPSVTVSGEWVTVRNPFRVIRLHVAGIEDVVMDGRYPEMISGEHSIKLIGLEHSLLMRSASPGHRLTKALRGLAERAPGGSTSSPLEIRWRLPGPLEWAFACVWCLAIVIVLLKWGTGETALDIPLLGHI